MSGKSSIREKGICDLKPYEYSIKNASVLDDTYQTSFFSSPHELRGHTIRSIVDSIEKIDKPEEMLHFFSELQKIKFMSATSFFGEKFPKYRLNYIDNDKNQPHAIVEDEKEKTNKTMHLIGKICQIKKSILSYKNHGGIIKNTNMDERILTRIQKQLAEHLNSEYEISPSTSVKTPLKSSPKALPSPVSKSALIPQSPSVSILDSDVLVASRSRMLGNPG